MWVEEGRNAPYGLPYSQGGEKDYSKSKFAGHHFIAEAVEFVLSSSTITTELAAQIHKNLQ
jgi:hypothetical protein